MSNNKAKSVDLLAKFHDASKRHIIALQWFGPPLVAEQDSVLLNKITPSLQHQEQQPNIEVIVSSRKLKGTEASPPDVLFRTHQYEIRLLPNQAFFDWGGGRKSGYMVDLKLFIKRPSSKNLDSRSASAAAANSSEKLLFHEYFVCDSPVITYTFLEDVFSNCWILNLQWPDERKCSFRGEFCFSLQVFRRVDDVCYRRVWHRTSSVFKIVSKPGVFLSRKKRAREESAEEAKEPKLANQPISHVKHESAAASSSNQFFDEHEFYNNSEIFND